MAPMPRLQRKSFTEPDQVRTFPHGRIDIVELDETSIGRFVCEPGWRWSTAIAPIVRTASCQNRHIGFAVGGSLHVVMDDGTAIDILPGDAYEIPPGHDAWVVGDALWDTVEFTSSRVFAVAPDEDDERTLATILFTDIVDFDRDPRPDRRRGLAARAARAQRTTARRPGSLPWPRGDHHG